MVMIFLVMTMMKATWRSLTCRMIMTKLYELKNLLKKEFRKNSKWYMYADFILNYMFIM